MDSRVSKIIEIVVDRPDFTLSSEEIVKTVNLSPARFRALFKQETGLTPTRYLKQVRLKAAAHLLSTSFLTVKEVMFKCGITDASHFARDFKRQFALSPTEFRAKSRDERRNKSLGCKARKLANK